MSDRNSKLEADGAITLIAGEARPAIEFANPPPPGDLFFVLSPDNVVLRFNADGKVFVRGVEVDDNQKIYEAAAYFFNTCRTAHGALAREALNEIANSFEAEADATGLAERGERFEEAFRRADQARAAATYVRIVRDTKFPVKP